MATQTREEHMREEPRVPHWNIGTRIVFRFSFVYLGLFLIYFCPIWLQYLMFMKRESPLVLGAIWPMRQIVFWAGAHIFRMTRPPSTGPGWDGSYYWVEAFCALVTAVLATVAWSVLNRRREASVTLYKWFRLVIRFALAAMMFSYGIFKVIPAQMPYPNLFELVRPFGHFLPIQVLWTYMGAGPAYEIFAGCAEVLGGILLLFPRTTTLGALICLADLTNVFVINLSYNVANKLQVFDFILLALFLLAPEFRRLANVFILNRAVPPSPRPQLFCTRRANRIAMAVQVVLAVYIIGGTAYDAWVNQWLVRASSTSKPALYGIWDVDQLSIDGQVRPPLLTDNERWRRIIFDSGVIWELNLDADKRVAFERPDDSLAYYRASINVRDKTVTLTDPDPDNSRKDWSARFTFDRPEPDRLTLDGEMDKRKLHMQLHLFDRKKFELVSTGFHWIQ
jgi:uncharacterized membrane protein YphA (DoxX/SURF4 family)